MVKTSKKIVIIVLVVLILMALLFLSIRTYYYPRTKKPNILLITTHSLRPGHLSCYGYKRFKTKAIDSMAKDGILFENAYCNTPISIYGYASIVSGKIGSSAVFRKGDNVYLNTSGKFLSEYLEENGYETVALIANPEILPGAGFVKGFNIFQNVGIDLPQAGFPFASRKITKEAINILMKIRRKRKPIFLWADYAIPKYPYIVPSYFLERSDDFAYDRQVVFLDNEISNLMDTFKKLGLDKNTIVILTATNGEALGEHEEPTHGVFLYDSTVKIPLIIKFPEGYFAGNRINKVVSHPDIIPTLLDLLGIEYKETDFDGVSLLKGIEEENDTRSIYLESLAGYNEFGWSPLAGIVSEGFKYIEAPEPELYDLTKDPHELKNIAMQNEEKAGELKNKLFKYMEQKKPHLLDIIARGEDPKGRVKILKPYLLVTHFGSGNLGWLINMYKNLLAMDPGNKTFQYVLANLFMRIRKPHLAEYYLKEYTKKYPESNQAWELLGLAYAQQKETDDAIKCYEKAIAIIPDMPVSLNNLAWEYAKKGIKLKEALKYAERANELLPNQPKMLDTLAEVHLKLGNKDEAIAILRKAILLDPESEYYKKRLEEIEGVIPS